MRLAILPATSTASSTARAVFDLAVDPAVEEHQVLSDLFDYDAEPHPHNELFRAAARVGAFPPTRFDLCVSRFGTMFFTARRG